MFAWHVQAGDSITTSRVEFAVTGIYLCQNLAAKKSTPSALSNKQTFQGQRARGRVLLLVLMLAMCLLYLISLKER